MSETKTTKLDLKALLEDKSWLKIPKVGDVVKGVIISLSKNEIRIDIEGYKTGVVRGRELFAEAVEYADLAVAQDVEATVIDLENEMGEVELSFRYAGQQKAWEVLRKLMDSGELIDAKIIEANKGGLLANVNHVNGFLPVSQLSPDNYPRVSGGDKIKILEKLKSFVGTTMKVKVIDVNEREEKLIVSEKSVWEEAQKGVLDKYKLGDLVEGAITAIADFGVFVKFDNLEGLVHISEIAWQRIDHPRDLVKVGEVVKAEIIGIEGSKIFLSMKKLIQDPWKTVNDKYKIGDKVEGKILKINPFGFFVELDRDIHGLAHISELSKKPVKNVTDIAKIGDTMTFKIVSIEPEQHRLGLSLKAMEEGGSSEAEAPKANA
ncbi:MAG: S1 RNA-binding domain-containing protein [Patescibacteria group bacterium]|jgi:small subunit ribosomal protein S1